MGVAVGLRHVVGPAAPPMLLFIFSGEVPGTVHSPSEESSGGRREAVLKHGGKVGQAWWLAEGQAIRLCRSLIT